MPIDASIALGVKPIEIPNQLAQLGQMYQLQNAQQNNQLNQLKMQEGQRAFDEQNQLRALYQQPGFDLSNPDSVKRIMGINPTQGMAMQKAQLENASTRSTIDKNAAETQMKRLQVIGSGLVSAMQNPDDATLATAFNGMDAVGIDTKPLRAHFAGVTDPAQRQTVIKQYAFGTPEGKAALLAVQPDIKMDDTGQQLVPRQTNPLAPGYTAPVAVQKVATPGDQLSATTSTANNAATNATSRANTQATLAQGRELAVRPEFNETSQGFIERPTKEKPTGGFIPLPDIVLNKEATSASKILKEIGYDPKSKTDRVTNLIDQSTGGLVQAGTTGLLGAFNVGTTGSAAIGKLETLANSMTMDLLGGKLGAGISNTDRDFIVGQLGNIANPRIPAETRAAAWQDVVEKLNRNVSNAPARSAPAAPKPGVTLKFDANGNPTP